LWFSLFIHHQNFSFLTHVFIARQGSSTAKGAVDPAHYFNFKLVNSSLDEQLGDPVAEIKFASLLGSFTDNCNESNFEPDLNHKRMAISARRTYRLRFSGLREILEKTKPGVGSMQDPSVYGSPEHYNRFGCWGASTLSHYGGLGILVPGVSTVQPPLLATASDLDVGQSLTAIHGSRASLFPAFPKLSDSLIITDEARLASEPAPINNFPPFKFDRYTFQKRIADKACWPKPNPKAITSRRNLAEMMTTRLVTGLLAKRGLIPVVVSLNNKDKQLLVRTSFGPMLDAANLPCKIGKICMAKSIYSLYRLKQGTSYNDAWNPDIWQLGCCIFRLPEKNGLPVDGTIETGLSPLGELIRIFRGLARHGFIFFGSGGVPVVNGFVSPSANSRAATDFSGSRDGATFEAAQSVSNKANYSMDQLCERGSPVPMFVTGNALPKQFRDVALPPGEQAMYLGTYRVVRCAQEEEDLEIEDINEMVRFYQEYYELNDVMLRFHLQTPKKYKAVPVNYEDRKYSLMEVDKRDDRKPLFVVPEGDSYQALLSTRAPNVICEKQMITEWISDNGHMEILEEPYVPKDAMTTATLATNKTTNSVVQPQRQAEGPKRPLIKRMAHQSKRRITFDKHWDILIKASIASFCRLLSVNVDVSGLIGPLIDNSPAVHTAKSQLANYTLHLGSDGPVSLLENSIGPEFQKSPRIIQYGRMTQRFCGS
jgi:hypothetical protein